MGASASRRIEDDLAQIRAAAGAAPSIEDDLRAVRRRSLAGGLPRLAKPAAGTFTAEATRVTPGAGTGAEPSLPQRLIETPFRMLEGGPITAAMMAAAPGAAAVKAAQFMGQSGAETTLPADVRARALEDPNRISEEEAATAGLQLAIPTLPATGVIGKALLGAATGAAYVPEDPAVGAVFGGLAGGAHAKLSGERMTAGVRLLRPVRPAAPEPEPLPTERQLPGGTAPTARATYAGAAAPMPEPTVETATGPKLLARPAVPAATTPEPATPAPAPAAPVAPLATPKPTPQGPPELPPIQGHAGARTQVLLRNGEALPAEYRIVSAADLQPSHNPFTFQPNPNYPATVQGRDYQRNKATQMAVQLRALRYDPNLALNPSESAAEGVPTILPNGVVLAGNERSMLPQIAAVHAPDRYTAYKEQLKQRAAAYGLDPAIIDQVDQPVLVRQLTGADVAASPQRWQDINRLSDEVATKQKSSVEEGAARAQRLAGAPAALEHFASTIEPEDTIASYLEGKHGKAFTKQLIDDGVISHEEFGKLTNERGELTEDGRTAVRRMMLSAAVGDPAAVSDAPASILDKLEHAVPAIVSVRGSSYDVTEPLSSALRMIAEAKAKGITLEDLRAQVPVFKEAPPDPRAVQLAEFLTTAKRADIKEAFRKYGSFARDAIANAGSVDMFGGPTYTPASLFEEQFGGGSVRVGEAETAYLPPKAVTKSAAFRAWFGDSKVVDKKGRPLVVYHGSNEAFGRFTKSRTGLRFGDTYGYSGKGHALFFFTDNAKVASDYAQPSEMHPLDLPNVMPVYLSLRQPLVIEAGGKGWHYFKDDVADARRGDEYDGVILRNVADHAKSETAQGGEKMDVYIAFEPNQIKSATGNRGTFSPASADIVKERAENLPSLFAGAQQSLLGESSTLAESDVGKRLAAPAAMGTVARAQAILADPQQIMFARSGRPTLAYKEALAIVNRGVAIGGEEMTARQPDIAGEEALPTRNLPDQMRLLESSGEYEPKLAVLHNLSADNLKFADKMGGLAVPSLGVVKQGQHYSGMGEITLLGKPHLGDPTAVPIHDADVYSTTFPRAEYPKAKVKDAQKLVDELRDASKQFDDRRIIDTVWDNAVNTPKPEETVVQMLRSPAVQAVFLKSKGITVEPVLEKARVEPGFVTTKAWRDFQRTTGYETNYSYADTPYREKLATAVKAAIEEQVARRKDPQIRELLRDALLKQWIGEDGLVPFGYTPRIDRALGAIGRMDVEHTETEARLAEALKGHENEFRDWVEKKVLPMHGAPFLRLGRSRVPYTLENIVEAMTGPVKNRQETLTFGEGQARAAAASRLSSVQYMRNASYRIEGEEKIEQAREHAKKLLSEWRDAVLPFYTERDWRGDVDTWHGLDASMRAVARWAKGRGLAEALRAEGFKGVPAYVVAQGVKAGQAFLDAPVPYFEAKPQRAVKLDEFAGAVIPKSAPAEVREILAKHGIETEEYAGSVSKGEPERGAAIARLQDRLERGGRGVLFERARTSFDAMQQNMFTPDMLKRSEADVAFGGEAEHATAVAQFEKETAASADYPTAAERGARVRQPAKSWVDIRGQDASTPEKLHAIVAPFRDPKMEQLGVIFLDGNKKVIGHSLYTSGVINYVQINGQRWAYEVWRRAKRLGAQGVILHHNHPSGDPTPSGDDVSFTNLIADQWKRNKLELVGHFVIDHESGSWITPNAVGFGKVGNFGARGVHDWTGGSGIVLGAPTDLWRLVPPNMATDGLTVAYLDSQYRLLALEPHDVGLVETAPAWLDQRAKALGARQAVFIVPSDFAANMKPTVVRRLERELWDRLTDIAVVRPGPDGAPQIQSQRMQGRDEPQPPKRGGKGVEAVQVFEREPDYLKRKAEFDRAKRAGVKSGLTDEQASAYAAAAKDIDFDGAQQLAQEKLEAGGLRARLRRWTEAAADQTKAIDRLSRAAVAGYEMPTAKSPEYQLALSYNSDDTIRRALYEAPEMATTHGVLDPITREPMGPTLESVVKPLGRDPEKVRQAFTYAVALRKVGRGLKGAAGDEGEYEAAIAAVEALGKVPMFQQFAQDLGTHLDAIGRYAVRSGLWNEQQWEALRNSDVFYIPFRRLMTHIEKPEPTKTYGTQRVNVTSGIKPFEGSRRFLRNPVEAVAGYDAAIIRRADAYRVGSAVIDALTKYMGEEGKAILTPLASNDPAVKAFRAAQIKQSLMRSGLSAAEIGMLSDLSAPMIDPHNPVIWRNAPGATVGMPPADQLELSVGSPTEQRLAQYEGGREYYLLNEPELYKALLATRADSPLGRGAIMTAFRTARRVMTVTATGINPRFALGLNIARDVPQAVMQNKGVRPSDLAVAFLEAFRAALGKSDFADILARHGLGSASIYAHDINPEAAARTLAPVTRGQKVGTLVSKLLIAPKALEVAERIGAASDLVGRFLAARAAQRRVLRAGGTARDAAAAGAIHGIRGTVNFNRRAGVPVLQFLEQSVPFFGATIRSIMRAGEAAAEVPGRVTATIGLLALAAIAEWAYSRRSKEQRAAAVDRPATERDRFLEFGRYRWPLPQEMAVVVAAMRLALAQIDRDDPDAAQQLKEAIYNLLPPFVSDLAQGDIIAPWPGIQQMQEVARNRQSYGQRPIVPERLQDLPPALQRSDNTSPTFDVLAAALRRGEGVFPGLGATSPLAVEHVVRGFLQNMTPLLTVVTDAALSAAGAEQDMPKSIPVPVTDRPLAPTSAFLNREPPVRTSSENWYYQRKREFEAGRQGERTVQRMEDVAETPAGLRRAQKARTLMGTKAWGLDEDGADDVRTLFKETDGRLREYRDAETDLRQRVNDGTLTPKDARLLLDALTRERQMMFRQVRAAMHALKVPN